MNNLLYDTEHSEIRNEEVLLYGKQTYVYIDVTMRCCRKMVKENARVMHDVLRETLGCDVVLGSFPSDARSCCTLKAYRNSVKLVGQDG